MSRRARSRAGNVPPCLRSPITLILREPNVTRDGPQRPRFNIVPEVQECFDNDDVVFA